MAQVTVWHGSDTDLRSLQEAVNHHCTCADEHKTCAPHAMLTDQNVLNHLAFVASARTIYIHDEFYL